MLRRFAPKAVLCYDPDSRRPDRRRAKLGAAGQRGLRRQRRPAAGRRGSRHVHPEAAGATRLSPQLKQSRPYLEFLLDRAAAEHDLTRDDSRREFLRRMLGVAARIPDPAARDQFADRLAHKARVTEEVVRAEIRKAAAARKTELPAERVPTLQGHVRKAEKGLLWALVHQPARRWPPSVRLEADDLEGLSTENLLRTARDLDVRAEDVPDALMERLSTQEARTPGLRRGRALRPRPCFRISACVALKYVPARA